METTNFYIQFGQFIKSGRLKKKLYQKDIAERIGVTQAYYSQVENGLRMVSMHVALDICKELDLNFNEFIYSLNKKKASVNRP